MRPVLLLLVIVAYGCDAFELPCALKLVGGACLIDEECYGVNSYCKNGRCACGSGFEAYRPDNVTSVCRPAPSTLNAECVSACAEPLVCSEGRCKCEGGEVRNGKCSVSCPAGQQLRGNVCRPSAKLNERCEKNEDCVDAFQVCETRLNRCTCAEGTKLDAVQRRCVATCPDGSTAGRSCKRLFINDVDLLEHLSGGDNCDSDQYCATYGSPQIGICCPIKCPHGLPDRLRSCDAGASGSIACRELTHFCHKFQGPGYSKSICCPRVCREPNPVYVNGECRREAHLGDACGSDVECEGNVTMRCHGNRCRCKVSDLSSGGVRYEEVQTNVRFPTCRRLCETGHIPHGEGCIRNAAPLNGECILDRQCPSNARCYYGKCSCKCGYVPDGSSCTNPDDPLGLNQLGPLTGILDRFRSGISPRLRS